MASELSGAATGGGGPMVVWLDETMPEAYPPGGDGGAHHIALIEWRSQKRLGIPDGALFEGAGIIMGSLMTIAIGGGLTLAVLDALGAIKLPWP